MTSMLMKKFNYRTVTIFVIFSCCQKKNKLNMLKTDVTNSSTSFVVLNGELLSNTEIRVLFSFFKEMAVWGDKEISQC
jgi:hypothetical protein